MLCRNYRVYNYITIERVYSYSILSQSLISVLCGSKALLCTAVFVFNSMERDANTSMLLLFRGEGDMPDFLCYEYSVDVVVTCVACFFPKSLLPTMTVLWVRGSWLFDLAKSFSTAVSCLSSIELPVRYNKVCVLAWRARLKWFVRTEQAH